MEGAGVGIPDKLGTLLGIIEGTVEKEGSTLGCADWDGTSEGYSDGGIDGMADILGFIDGCSEVEGCMEGIEEGASLCGKAPEITKSAKTTQYIQLISLNRNSDQE